jgi:hypothetical protein
MIALAREKPRRAGSRHRIDFGCIPMEAVGRSFKGRPFDGAFSNFGAVNCTEDLSAPAMDSARLMPTNGAWMIMGRRVP